MSEKPKRKPWHEMSREEKRATVLENAERYPDRNSRHMLELDDRYPAAGLYDEGCIGADVGPGWTKLVDPCLEVLARHGCKVTQIKQKFCELRVYWDGPSWLRPAWLEWYNSGKVGPNPEDLFREVKMVIELMAHRSLYMCERCSAQAEQVGTVMSGTRLCTRCKEERNAQLKA